MVFVDRSAEFAVDSEVDPLRLVVSIDEAGKLKLNKIETGTISDLTDLSKKIAVIFADRDTAGIVYKEVLIDPQGDLRKEDLNNLIRSLAEANASPIRMIHSVPKITQQVKQN